MLKVRVVLIGAENLISNFCMSKCVFSGTVNIHPSLLPLYRGAAPVQRALQVSSHFGLSTFLFFECLIFYISCIITLINSAPGWCKRNRSITGIHNTCSGCWTCHCQWKIWSWWPNQGLHTASLEPLFNWCYLKLTEAEKVCQYWSICWSLYLVKNQFS